MLRDYELVDRFYRETVNLEDYNDVIVRVHGWYDIPVAVYEHYYEIEIEDEPDSLLRQIGIELAKSELGKFAVTYKNANGQVKRRKLFEGHDCY